MARRIKIGTKFNIDDFAKPDCTFKEDPSAWNDIIFRMGRLNIPKKVIADYCGTTLASFNPSLEQVRLVMAGQAEHRLIIDGTLMELAELDVSAMDPEERAHWIGIKWKALETLKKCLNKLDEWIPPEETERVRRLTDEELLAKLAEIKRNG
jgi:hypothetical protein